MANNKRLAINMIANIIAFGVQFGINFFLTPYLIETLGSAAYGFVPLANNIIGYIGIITAALNSMAGRFISIEINQGDNKRANEYFNSVLAANTILAIVLAVPGALFVLLIDRMINVPASLLTDVQLTFAYALLGFEISLVLSVFGICFFVKNRMDLSAKRNIEGNIIRAVILVTLFVFLKPKIYFITATMLLVTAYTCAANWYYTKKITPELQIGKKYFSGSAIRILLSSGIWNSVNQLSIVLLTTLDLLLANIFFGALSTGQYSVVKTVPNFIQSIASVLVSVFVPQFVISYAKKRDGELLEEIDFSVKIMGFFMSIPIGFLLVFGLDFFSVWVPSQNAALLQGLSVLTLIPLVVTTSVNTIYNVYTVTNRLRIPALVWLIFGVINTVTVIVLAKSTSLGIWGIPIAACVWGLVRNLTFTPIYAAYCLKVKWFTFYKAIMRGMICVLSVVVLCALYRYFLGPQQSWAKLFVAGLVCSIIVSLANLIVVFTKDERQRLFNKFVSKFHK